MNEDDSPQNALECHDECHISNGMLVDSYLRFLFLWQTMFRLSDVALGILLAFFAMMVQIFGKNFSR